jgi:predicted lipoprotein with Yx(FWY)xxD motif
VNRTWTNRASIARLLLPLAIVGVVSACTGATSSASAPSAPPSSQSASAASPSTAASPAPTARPSPTASPKPASPRPSASAPSSGDVTIHTAKSASLGTYLAAPDGKTLYTLSSDPTDKSTCAGACATAWPPLLIAADGKISQPTTVMGTFGIIKRADGTHQVTFDGHPLYKFVKDTAPGQTNGEGIVAFGGKWLVAKAA